jgi:tetratricopeptide (TPR) repeat protein
MPWMVGMLAFAVVAVVLVVRFTAPDPNAAPGMQGAAPGFGAGAPAGLDAPAGPMGGTMRENADRLFNRVMSEREAGASDRVEFFVPMAIQAYQASGELDADGLYHLALLQNVAGQPEGALETANRILATAPGHLLALATAAEAAALAGDSTSAAGYYRTFLESYELERALSLPEYVDHARVIPEYRTAAESFLNR